MADKTVYSVVFWLVLMKVDLWVDLVVVKWAVLSVDETVEVKVASKVVQ